MPIDRSSTHRAVPAAMLLWAALAGCRATETIDHVDGAGASDAHAGDADASDAMAIDSAIQDASIDQPGDAMPGDGAIQVDWRVPEGHFVPAKMPMTLVHPRPDAETNSWARYRKAHPGIEYRIPISVQGGAYPFYYEIIRGPSGMTMGQQYGQTDYGILKWTPSEAAAAQTVEVRVTDQDLHTVTAEWQITATTEGFVFVDVNVASSGDGTISSPLKLFSELASGHAAKIAYLRGGTHFTADAPQKEFLIRSDASPMTLLGHPGEETILDLSNTNFRTKSGSLARDFFVGGLRIRNTYVDPGGTENSRMFDMDGTTGHRFTLFENDFENVYGRGAGDYSHLPSGSNQGIVHIGTKHGGAYDQYWTLWGNTMANVQVRGFGSLYGTQYGVLEDNTMREPVSQSNGSSARMIDLKAQNDAWSWRRNTGIVEGLNSEVFQQRQGTGPATPGALRVEMCYNLLRMSTSTDHTISFAGSAGDSGYENENWIYRNTIIGRMAGDDFGTNYTTTFENNAYITDGVHYQPTQNRRTIVVIDDLTGTDSDLAAMLDEEYKLKGQYRDEYLGRRGHEVAP